MPRRLFLLLMPLGFVATAVAFYPGIMTIDSQYQFGQALNGQFSDWHPVIMAIIWSGTNAILPGPGGMLILFLSMYWLAFLLIARSLIDRSAIAFYGVMAAPFLPFIINYSGVIWKDVLVFDCFLLAFAGILFFATRGKRIPLALQVMLVGLLSIGALARHNSILAAAPLLAFMFWPQAPQRNILLATIKRIMLGTLAIVVLFFALNFAIDATLAPRRTYPIGALFIFDIVGISSRTGIVLVPGNWTSEQSDKILHACYEPDTWDHIWVRCNFMLEELRRTGQWQHLLGPWWRAVSGHPLHYIAHRFDYVVTFFYTIWYPFIPDISKVSVEYGFRENWLYHAIKGYVLGVAAYQPLRTLFTNGFWLVVTVLTFLWSAWIYLTRSGAGYAGLLLSASATLYVLPLTLIGVAWDFRYSYWGVGATTVAIFMAFDAWRKARDPRANPGASEVTGSAALRQ